MHVAFNNNRGDDAPTAAQRLRALLGPGTSRPRSSSRCSPRRLKRAAARTRRADGRLVRTPQRSRVARRGTAPSRCGRRRRAPVWAGSKPGPGSVTSVSTAAAPTDPRASRYRPGRAGRCSQRARSRAVAASRSATGRGRHAAPRLPGAPEPRFRSPPRLMLSPSRPCVSTPLRVWGGGVLAEPMYPAARSRQPSASELPYPHAEHEHGDVVARAAALRGTAASSIFAAIASAPPPAQAATSSASRRSSRIAAPPRPSITPSV